MGVLIDNVFPSFTALYDDIWEINIHILIYFDSHDVLVYYFFFKT